MATETRVVTPAGDASALCSVLVPSCDAYADLWRPFFSLFFRYWPDCPFPVYLGSNDKAFDHPRVSVLHAGGGTHWAKRVREQIEAVPTEYVLLILEDFFLRSPVPTERALACLNSLVTLGGRMLRLVARPGPQLPLRGHADIGMLERGCPYRVSTQASYWRGKDLLALMLPDESIWQFELAGSRRSDNRDGFFAVWKDVLTYRHHVVERGRWFPHEALRFSRMNIGIDLSAREVMSPRELTRWGAAKAVSIALDTLPWRTRSRVVGLVKAGLGRAWGS